MSAPCPILGFVTRVRVHDAADVEALMESLNKLLEANDLVGNVDRTLELTVTREGSQATQADRELVFDWARGQTQIAGIDISDLIDLARA